MPQNFIERRQKTLEFYEKITITNNVIEVRCYERLNVTGGGARDGLGEYSEHNYRNTQKARRTRIRQLITSNFDSHSKFVTLTFDGCRDFDIKDVRQCNNHFAKFLKRIKRRYPNFKYVAVIEFQDKNDRGAVHYHMICNLPYIKKSELAKLWEAGFIKINAIDKVDNVGAYVVKYMQKDIDDKRLQGVKAYNHSTGLVEPVELKSWLSADGQSLEDINALTDGKTPSYTAMYESDEAGIITYTQYNLSR